MLSILQSNKSNKLFWCRQLGITLKEESKKYAKLLHQASIATGRKEAVGLLHKAAKLQNKLDRNSEN